MRLSLKHMVISFAVALVVLSVVMSVICVSAFRDNVRVHPSKGEGVVVEGLPRRSFAYDFASALVYYAEEDGVLSYAALVCISDTDKVITVTPVAATLPVHYQGSIYFVSSICREEGIEALLDIASALTGVEVDSLVEAERYHISAESAEVFAVHMTELLKERYKGYEIKRVSVLLDKDGMADSKSTAEQFFKVELN